MKKARWVSAAAGTALVAAMFALPGAGVAYASGTGNVTGNGNLSLLSGNTVTVPVSAPVNLCGVSLAVLGFSNSGCEDGPTSCIGDNCVPPTCGCQTRPPCQGTCAAPTRPGTSNSTGPARTTAGPARTTTAMSSGTGPARTTGGPARTTTAMSGGDPAASGAGPESATAVTAAMVGSGLPATGAGPDSATTAMSGGDPAASGAGPESATAVTAAMTDSGLPTTGADLLLLGAAALGSIGVGAGTVALARRRRHGEAS